MKRNYFHILPFIIALVVLGFLKSELTYAHYIIKQITVNCERCQTPRINNIGDVVWSSENGTEKYENLTKEIIQVTSRVQSPLNMNNRGDIAYQEADDEIYFFDASTRSSTRITHDTFSDYSPTLNDNGEIVWRGDMNERMHAIFYYDGSDIHEIPNSRWPTSAPWINNDSKIVWSGYDSILGEQIYFYDNDATTQLTTDEYNDWGPLINDTGHIVWAKDEHSGQELYIHDGHSAKKITNGGSANTPFDINNNGDVAWEKFFGGDLDQKKIILYDNLSETVNELGPGLQPGMSGKFVTWQVPGYKKIFVYDGSTTTPIYFNNPDLLHQHPDVNNRGDIAWVVKDGIYQDIYLAIRIPYQGGDFDGDGDVDGDDLANFTKIYGINVEQ